MTPTVGGRPPRLQPFVRSEWPDNFYCSSFVTWAYRNVKAVDDYLDSQFNPWISPDDLMHLGGQRIGFWGDLGGGARRPSARRTS